MRIQLILLLLFSLSAMASDEKSVNDLFQKYDQVMDQKKVELVDEVFTQKFLKESGGKEEFISKVKELPKAKSIRPSKVSWHKGKKTEMYFARLKPVEKGKESNSQFILKKENGKLKIDGTIGDDN